MEQRADPWIYKHTDGYYYFTASVPEYDRIELRRAKTIEGLAEAPTKNIWHKHDKGEMSHLIWAPELHYVHGKWYIYFAAGHTMEVLDHRIYVLACEAANPLEGEWREKGKLDTKSDQFALDATSFLYNNQQYLVWAQQEPSIPGHSNLYIAKMSTPWVIEGTPVMLSKPQYGWECVNFAVNEGPAVLIQGDKLFISYSASGVDRNYCMGLLWCHKSDNFLNPAVWHKSPGPVFVTSDANSQYGPGHNCFTTAEDGATDLLVYHSRDYEKVVGDPLYDSNRHARVQPFSWTDDGMPDFGIPAKNS